MYICINLLCERIQLVPREQVLRKSQPTQSHDKVTCGLEEAIREPEKLEHVTPLSFFLCLYVLLVPK